MPHSAASPPPPRPHPVVGVVGGSGGIGASTFSAALAAAAQHSVLCDLDPLGGGIDVLLEIDDEPGARWSGVHVNGGRLSARVLSDGLPRWGDLPVLALDTAVAPSAADALQIVDVCAELGTVVVDLGRVPTPAREVVISRCTLVVVLARADLAPLSAAHAVAATIEAPLGVVLRPGPVPPDRAAHVIGAHLLGSLPDVAVAQRGGRLSRRIARVAAALLDGVGADPPALAKL